MALDSRYGPSFPSIPEMDTGDQQINELLKLKNTVGKDQDMAKPGNAVSGRKGSNRFLNNSTDPNTSTVSVGSLNSVNLDLINRRNDDRLARLEGQNDDALNDSNLFRNNGGSRESAKRSTM